MAHQSSNNKPPTKPLASQPLHRTLQELDAALADWDRIVAKPPAPHAEPTSPALSAHDEEMRERTKKLLQELRKQLSEL